MDYISALMEIVKTLEITLDCVVKMIARMARKIYTPHHLLIQIRREQEEMEIQKAIENINFMIEESDVESSIGAIKQIKRLKVETFKVALSALEKDIPKKLSEWANGTKHCPNEDCEQDMTALGFKRCICCGQLLDWNDNQ